MRNNCLKFLAVWLIGMPAGETLAFSPGIFPKSNSLLAAGFLGDLKTFGGIFTVLILILLVLAVIFLLLVFMARGLLPDKNKAQQELARLQKTGPPVSTPEFLEKFNNIFIYLMEAWPGRNLELCRPYVTDDFFRRLSKNKFSQPATVRHIRQDLAVSESKIVKVESEGGYDSITVIFHASLVDYKIDDATGAVVSDNQSDPYIPLKLSESWVFTRKTGPAAAGGGMKPEKKCLHCGAPLDIRQAGRCPYCGVLVISAEFDWVLTEIFPMGVMPHLISVR